MRVEEQSRAYKDYVDALVAFNVAEEELAAKVADAEEKRKKSIDHARRKHIEPELSRLGHHQLISLVLLAYGMVGVFGMFTDSTSGVSRFFAIVGAVAFAIGLIIYRRAASKRATFKQEIDRVMRVRSFDA